MKTKNSHYGESASSRADKMSGVNTWKKKEKERYEHIFKAVLSHKLSVGSKKFFNRKRRMFLKNPLFYEKI
jgi:hypothetical protein